MSSILVIAILITSILASSFGQRQGNTGDYYRRPNSNQQRGRYPAAKLRRPASDCIFMRCVCQCCARSLFNGLRKQYSVLANNSTVHSYGKTYALGCQLIGCSAQCNFEYKPQSECKDSDPDTFQRDSYNSNYCRNLNPPNPFGINIPGLQSIWRVETHKFDSGSQLGRELIQGDRTFERLLRGFGDDSELLE